MGKASRAKAEARQARERGEVPKRERRNLKFPLLLLGVVVAGVLVIVLARDPSSPTQVETINTSTTVGAESKASDPVTVTPSADAPPRQLGHRVSESSCISWWFWNSTSTSYVECSKTNASGRGRAHDRTSDCQFGRARRDHGSSFAWL